MQTINVPIKLTNEAIENIIYTSLYACRYWMTEIGYTTKDNKRTYNGMYTTKILNMGGKLNITAYDDYENKKLRRTLTLKKLIKGIQKYASIYGIQTENGKLDTSSLDDNACDLIIQYSIFGKQVFA